MSHRRPSTVRLDAAWPDVGRVERFLWLVAVLALAGDLVTTYAGLRVGMVESNPVARSAIARFGFAALLGIKAFAVGVGIACRPLLPDEYTAVVPAGLALPWAVATLLNLSLFL